MVVFTDISGWPGLEASGTIPSIRVLKCARARKGPEYPYNQVSLLLADVTNCFRFLPP